MQSPHIPSAAILSTVAQGYALTANSSAPLYFGPVPDNTFVFSTSSYATRQAQGQFARIPTMFTSADNEGGLVVPFTPAGPAPNSPEEAAMNQFTNWIGCGAASAAQARRTAGVKVWRVRYFGTWANLNPYSWLGAYHGSDIPILFGTSNLTGPDTRAEAETSAYYQGAWAAFARDPVNGLENYGGRNKGYGSGDEKTGWPTYDARSRTLVTLSRRNSTSAVFEMGTAFDRACGNGSVTGTLG